MIVRLAPLVVCALRSLVAHTAPLAHALDVDREAGEELRDAMIYAAAGLLRLRAVRS